MEEIKKLGIIAGGGQLPNLLAEHCLAQEIPFHMVVFKGQPQPTNAQLSQVTELSLGQVGKVIKTLKKEEVSHLVMVGDLEKPSLFDLKIDLKGLKILNRIRTKHDDALLTSVCHSLEEEGFKILGAHEIREDLLMPSGLLTKKKPSEEQQSDIKIGLEAVKLLGSLDIGQAAVIKDGVVLGVEGAEGTKELIARCALLRGKKGKGGILIKAAKPKQNLKVDMPTIGLNTIKQLSDLHYDGITVLSRTALFIEQKEAIKKADKNRLFICGVNGDGNF